MKMKFHKSLTGTYGDDKVFVHSLPCVVVGFFFYFLLSLIVG